MNLIFMSLYLLELNPIQIVFISLNFIKSVQNRITSMVIINTKTADKNIVCIYLIIILEILHTSYPNLNRHTPTFLINYYT